jgi:hypothetical protein
MKCSLCRWFLLELACIAHYARHCYGRTENGNDWEGKRRRKQFYGEDGLDFLLGTSNEKEINSIWKRKQKWREREKGVNEDDNIPTFLNSPVVQKIREHRSGGKFNILSSSSLLSSIFFTSFSLFLFFYLSSSSSSFPRTTKVLESVITLPLPDSFKKQASVAGEEKHNV